MFFFGVFNLIMTDPVQRLNEHHHGGNSRARDFGGVRATGPRACGAKCRKFPGPPARKDRVKSDETERVRCSRDVTRSLYIFLRWRNVGWLPELRNTSGQELWLSRSRWSSVTSQRPTTAVTMPGKVFTLPMVQTASSCFLAMVRISSASFAAAARASRRAFMGVEPECASCPWNVMLCRSTPFVPKTTP